MLERSPRSATKVTPTGVYTWQMQLTRHTLQQHVCPVVLAESEEPCTGKLMPEFLTHL